MGSNKVQFPRKLVGLSKKCMLLGWVVLIVIPGCIALLAFMSGVSFGIFFWSCDEYRELYLLFFLILSLLFDVNW